MDFEEALEVVRGLPGRTVEVSIQIPFMSGGHRSLASFSGQVRKVSKSGARALLDHWFVWFEDDGAPKPNHGMFTLDRETFQWAEVKGSGRSLEEVEAEDDEHTGTTWEIELVHAGVVTEVLIYV